MKPEKNMKKKPVIRITKKFGFEAAHALWNYDGPCKNIHGHSYVLYVTIAGHPVNDPDNPKHGMVMDFSVLKKIVNDEIIGRLDHALMINAHSPHLKFAKEGPLFGKIVAMPYQPTCENMVADFAECLQKALPGQISLVSLRLHETDTAYAEWLAEDNTRC